MSGDETKILFVGGTGTISHSCVLAAVDRGFDVYVLNRGQSSKRQLPAAVTVLCADIRDEGSTREVLGDHHFRSVVDFLCFDAEQAAAAVELFRDRTDQYIQISSASIYHKPIRRIPIVESTLRHNPFTSYARDKIAAEDVVLHAYEDEGFPATIVRPSHTYDDANPPLPGDWTVVDRLFRGAEILVPGDGTSLWTLTHAADLAQGLVGLLANPVAIGEVFHITSDEIYTWDQIYEIFAAAAGVEPRILHVSTELIALAAPDWFWSELLMGDLRYSAVFDNAKIRRHVPSFAPRITLSETVPRMLAWRAARPDATAPDRAVDAVLDRVVSAYHAAEKIFARRAGH